MAEGDGDSNARVVFRDESAKFNLSSRFFQETPNQDLAFVNLTSSAAQNEGERTLVRSHVQRSVYQQKQAQRYSELQVQRPIMPMHGSMPLVVHTGPAFDPSGMMVLPQQDAGQPDFYEEPNRNPETNYLPSSSQGSHAHMRHDAQGLWIGNTNSDLALVSQTPSIEPTSPSNGRLDPFNTLPFLPNGREQTLMYHCKSNPQFDCYM